MATDPAGQVEYLRSIAGELLSQANRVRQLIGDAHWLSDGQHKERLLRSVINRHLPAPYVVTRGFVINPRDPRQCSTEQDILVIDGAKDPPLFRSDDLVITASTPVVAAISVKSQLRSDALRDAVGGLSTLPPESAPFPATTNRVWKAVFFFTDNPSVDATPTRVYDWLSTSLAECSLSPESMPDVVATADRWLYRRLPSLPNDLLGYDCAGAAAAVFVASLLDHLASLAHQNPPDFVSLVEGLGCQPLTPEAHALISPRTQPPLTVHPLRRLP